MTTKPLTGRKVFAIVASFFAVIIGVNLFMAFSAVSTFPGLETRNSYVASQKFDDARTAQEALGWQVVAGVENGELTVLITDDAGLPAEVQAFAATLGRPTHIRDDMNPKFERRAGVYHAPIDLAPGNWNIRLVATAIDGTEFRQRLDIRVRN